MSKRQAPSSSNSKTSQPQQKKVKKSPNEYREQDKQYKYEQSVRYSLDFNNPDCPMISWYDWNEWLFVKRYLFDQPETTEFSERAMEILGMWKNKFKIQTSTIVEASYLFLEGLRLDSQISVLNTQNHALHVNVKSIQEQALSNAIVRFVNLFSKDGKTKQASTLAIGSRQADCPKMLVDVRNEISHRKFPSIEILRNCAKLALKWIKQRYWDKQEEHLLNYQKEWIQNSNQYIILFKQRMELPQVEEAFDKKEKQRRKERIDLATRDIEKVEEKLISQSKGPCCSFIIQTFLLQVLTAPQYNTRKTSPDMVVNKVRHLLDFLDSRIDFVSGLITNIFIIVRDFELYSSKYNIEKHPMIVVGCTVSFETIELAFGYFDSLLRMLIRKSKERALAISQWISEQVEISKSELLEVLQTTIHKHLKDEVVSSSHVPLGVGDSDTVLFHHLLKIEDIASNTI
ncbi:hypothetical protein C9374_014464 [Naegleria lovaniensis]|uniref:Las1-like protein n=1 Tax=Naegleria lovaniensis TaxID=51637 RepID=A0AA88KPF7_NAELO|nr:uncharacterized protein C9374_014464 [Naegleria lovaniensis]KAG2389064.1 hypothetical protein C9374_014464 [Naegleria lovaniensis]